MVRADGTGLVFAIKDAGRFTARLRRLPVGATVPADGPYGAFTWEAQLDDRPAVLVAGGIGVTPFVHLALRHPDATLFHAARHRDEALVRPRPRTPRTSSAAAPGS
ncbi:hypothetical protein ACBJ59_09640 [Nonomuraea sp. MTCD27]|uniref:hypothetical protein n=1 Tax=Nonomuraea sp. MTCD27 TaxID=1676747 RepID=UPI0035C1AE0A